VMVCVLIVREYSATAHTSTRNDAFGGGEKRTQRESKPDDKNDIMPQVIGIASNCIL